MRRVANWANLSTPVGLLLSRAAGARPRATPEGLHLATGYRWPFPDAGAFTIGDVVLTRSRRSGSVPCDPLPRDVWEHEVRHSEQYVWCAGLPFLPLYGLAAVGSWLLTADPWSANPFERAAGLEAGGYRRGTLRPTLQRISRPRRRG